MLINLVLNVIVLFIGALFSWLPAVTALPTIAGFNIDAALVTGIGSFNRFITFYWPIYILFQGALFLVGYYTIKIGLRFLLGHRAPD